MSEHSERTKLYMCGVTKKSPLCTCDQLCVRGEQTHHRYSYRISCWGREFFYVTPALHVVHLHVYRQGGLFYEIGMFLKKELL